MVGQDNTTNSEWQEGRPQMTFQNGQKKPHIDIKVRPHGDIFKASFSTRVVRFGSGVSTSSSVSSRGNSMLGFSGVYVNRGVQGISQRAYSSDITPFYTTQDMVEELMESFTDFMGRNTRKVKKANHGKRPCNNLGRKKKRRKASGKA